MNKLILTDVIVSRGYENAPAVKFNEAGNAAFFTIGKRVYDKKAEGDHRFINMDVKAFGELTKRVEKMGIKEGSYLHIVGRIDEETWEDSETKKMRRKTIIILDDIEYAYSGNANKEKQNTNGGNSAGGGQNGYGGGNPGMGAAPPQYQQQAPQQPYPQQAQAQYQQPAPQQGQMPQNFTGFENFGGTNGGGNPFFKQG